MCVAPERVRVLDDLGAFRQQGIGREIVQGDPGDGGSIVAGRSFPGHIAGDAASRSELVVPISADGRLIGVLDLDSPLPGRFSPDDAWGAEVLVARIARRLAERR